VLRKLSPVLAGLSLVLIAGGVAWAANSTPVTTTDLVDVDVAAAGTVTLEVADLLTITDTQPASGWSVEVEIATGREVEATFRNGADRVDFNAELEDGQVKVRIRERATGSETVTFIGAPSTTVPGGDDTTSTSLGDGSSSTTEVSTTQTSVADTAPSSTTVTTTGDDGTTSTSIHDDDDDATTSTTVHDDDDDEDQDDDDHATTSTTVGSTTSTTVADGDDSSATAFDGTYQYSVTGGSVTVSITNGRLSLVAVSPAAGWSHQIDKLESDRIEVEFESADSDAKIEIRTDDGRLEVELDD
jgi:hypothetical protein